MIKRILHLTSFEISKAIRWKFTWISLFIAILGCMASSVLPELLHKYKEAELNGFTLTATVAHFALFPIGAFLTVVFSALTMGQEHSHRTLPTLLALPIRRVEVAVSKLLVCVAYVFVLTFTIYAVSMIISLILIGFDPIQVDLQTTISFAGVWHMYIVGAFFSAVPLIATATAILALTSITENSGTAIGLAVGIAFLMALVEYSSLPKGFALTHYFGSASSMLLDMGEQIAIRWFPDLYMMLAVCGAYIVATLSIFIGVLWWKDAT